MRMLLTPRQVAERLAVSPRTVYLWIEQGRLPAVRLSERVTRVPVDAVDALIESAATRVADQFEPAMAAEAPSAYVVTPGRTEASRDAPLPTARLRTLLSEHRTGILQIAEHRRVRNVRLIGSVARGDARDDSDIDLLVDLAPDASLYDLSGFAGEVETLLGVRVDVAVARSLKPGVCERALREAVPL